MTPETPSPSDNPSPPPRHQPKLDALAKETTESDLWDDLDSAATPATLPEPRTGRTASKDTRPAVGKASAPLPGGEEEAGDAPAIPGTSPAGNSFVVRRVDRAGGGNKRRMSPSSRKSSPLQPSSPAAGHVEADFDDLDTSGTAAPVKPGPRMSRESAPPPPAVPHEAEPKAPPLGKPRKTLDSDLGELDQWEEPVEEPVARLHPAEQSPIVGPESEPAAADPDAPADPGAVETPTASQPDPKPAAEDTDEGFSAPPPAKPKESGTAAPRMFTNWRTWSRFEKSAVAAVAVLLVAILAIGYHMTFGRFGKTLAGTATPLPAKGKLLTIDSVRSYWRPPTTGANAENVQPGTLLIPVAEVTVSGNGALRVLFTDENGESKGDAVLRQISGETKLTLPATAGFDDIAKLAGYQAAADSPWHLIFAEAQGSSAAGSDFTELARIPIQPDRR